MGVALHGHDVTCDLASRRRGHDLALWIEKSIERPELPLLAERLQDFASGCGRGPLSTSVTFRVSPASAKMAQSMIAWCLMLFLAVCPAVQGQGCGPGTIIDPLSGLCVIGTKPTGSPPVVDPSVGTADGNLQFAVADGKTVSVKTGSQEDPHFVSTVVPGSIVDAVKLGYQLGQAASKNDLDKLANLGEVKSEVAVIAGKTSVLEGTLDAVGGRVAILEGNAEDSASKEYCDRKVSTATSSLLKKLNDLQSEHDKVALCSASSKFFKDGKCVDPPGVPSVVPLDGCKADTVGAARYDEKIGKVVVCTLNDKKQYAFTATGVGIGAGTLGQTEGDPAPSCRSLQQAGQTTSGVWVPPCLTLPKPR